MKTFFLLFLILYSTSASALDQMRKGMFVGFGMGVANLKSELTLKTANTTESFNDAGASAQFKIGSGVIKKFGIFTDINHRQFLSQSEQNNYFITDVGLGAQYYFNSYVRSGYLLGSVSTAFLGFTDEALSMGRTYKAGIGFEFLQSWQFELSYQDSAANINHTLYDHFDSQSVQFTINYLWY